MPNVDRVNFQVTDELTLLRQRVAELEQSEISYQQRQVALEEELAELKRQLPVEVKNPYIQVVNGQIENDTSTVLNLAKDVVAILQQLQQEIAERKQIEVLLRESEERLRLALDVSQMGLWDWNIVTNQVIWSENYELLFGLVPSSFAGPYETFKKCVHPEDRQSVMQAIANALVQRTDYNDEFRIVRSDQSVHWISAKGKFIYDAQGQAVRMIGVCMETTVCKQAEETTRELTTQIQEQVNILNAILTASVDQIYIFNGKGCYQYVSRDGATVLGLKPQDIVGKTLPELDLPAQLITQVDNQRQAVMKTGQPIKDEYKYVTAEGVHYYEYILTPFRNIEQTIEGIITVCRDITDVSDELRLRKSVEKERDRLLEREMKARKQAEIAHKVKDEFLAVLSHELRTPLNSVLGWSKMLRTRNFDEKTTNHALETIERNAKLQTQLIEDLLDVSRILQGKLNLNVCRVSLVMVVEAALETVRLAAQAKSIQIQTIFDASLAQVMGDPNRLQQVVWNLFSNAVKFTPTGGRVGIRLMEADNQVQIQVSDTGKGISPDFLPYVFDYFRQSDGTTTRTFGGLGLGLAIVRKVVEMHGGKVQAESPGEEAGATFTVELPLLVRSEQVRGEENQSSPYALESSLLSDTQILVVDDEPDIRDLVTFILQDYGMQVTAVASAQEALQALSESIPDVLISDIGMPKTDGYMLMREVRSRSPQQGGHVPAIALTAYAGEMNQQQALAAGFQMHISKPVDPDALVKAIADLIKPS
ncbi:PAS domain-containing hybrid sensor histidine kinase/response regulator [Nostoc sp.]|uniref:PAS domain-containing hybrid sensor histidine kinase/response regulator n=1 Tax=Nostoc sp. TaxID=1180 RepID=UPI002FFB83AA